MGFVDTHAHLVMLEHDDEKIIVERAKAQNVSHMVSVATEASNWDSTLKCAKTYEHVYATLGLHPHEAKDWQALKSRFERYFLDGIPEKCVAIGETGLDYHYMHSNKEDQRRAFFDQCAFARQHKLPVIIHCRDAFEDTYEIVSNVFAESPADGVMHCFTGNTDQMKQAVQLGLYVSFSGILTFKNASAIQEAAKHAPEDRILLETDCPFLAPQPHRGKPNEPSLIQFTAQKLAELRGLPIEKVMNFTQQNAFKLFRLPA